MSDLNWICHSTATSTWQWILRTSESSISITAASHPFQWPTLGRWREGESIDFSKFILLLFTCSVYHGENVLSIARYDEFIETKLHAISDELVIDFVLLPREIQFIRAVAVAAACDGMWKANGCHAITAYQKLFHQLCTHNEKMVHDAEKYVTEFDNEVSKRGWEIRLHNFQNVLPIKNPFIQWTCCSYSLDAEQKTTSNNSINLLTYCDHVHLSTHHDSDRWPALWSYQAHLLPCHLASLSTMP